MASDVVALKILGCCDVSTFLMIFKCSYHSLTDGNLSLLPLSQESNANLDEVVALAKELQVILYLRKGNWSCQ